MKLTAEFLLSGDLDNILKETAEAFLKGVKDDKNVQDILKECLNTYFTDAENYDNYREVMESVVQNCLSDLLCDNCEELGLDFKSVFGKKYDDAPGVIVWEMYGAPRALKVITPTIDKLIKIYGVEMMQMIVNFK